MNETRPLMFGLKMSPIPGEKNKRLDRLPPRVVGWETVPLPSGKAATTHASALVMSSSLAQALFPHCPH